MTTPTTDPAPAEHAAPAPPARRVLRATPVIATIGVVVALLGLGLLLVPISTPTQDCGAPLAFLLDGRVDELVSETDPPADITVAEAKANNAEPCRARVADRAKPAGVLFAAGMVAGVGAAIVELAVRGTDWMRRRPARGARPAATGPPPAPDAS